MSNATFVNLLGATMLLASIYCLVNVGMVVLYRATGVLNFAQGQYVMLGAYIMSSVAPMIGYWPGMLVSALILGIVGWAGYHLLFRFLLGADEFRKVIMSFMVAIIITQFVVIIWGTDTREIDPPASERLQMLGGAMPAYDVIAAVTAIVVVFVLMLFISRTISGLRMRALSMNETLATYYGIKVHRLAAFAWAIAGANGAIAGIIYAQSTSVSLPLAEVGLLAFPAAVLGGLDSVGGSILASLIVAAVLTVSGFYMGGYWSNMIEYGLLLAVLLVRPYGLYGTRIAHRI